jgi:hypothetical protein
MGEYMQAGKIIKNQKAVRISSLEARIMRELFADSRPFIQKHREVAERISDLYYKKGKSVRETADLLGVSQAFVMKEMDLFGMPRREGGATGGSWYSSLSDSQKKEFNRGASKRALQREAKKKP